eukprot:9976693-Alexandrium_andersonii.AAC.1
MPCARCSCRPHRTPPYSPPRTCASPIATPSSPLQSASPSQFPHPPACIPGAPSCHGWQCASCSLRGNTYLRATP